MGLSKNLIAAVLVALALPASAAFAQPGQDKKSSAPARQVTVSTYGADRAAPAPAALAREERARASAPEPLSADRKDRGRKAPALGIVARPDGSLARRD